MVYFYAFIIGGIICGFGQILKDVFKISSGNVVLIFVFLGSLLEIGNFYDKLISLAHIGALLPIMSFGHSLTHACLNGAYNNGILGIFSNIYSNVNVGISFTLFMGVIIGLFFKPKR